MRESSLSYCEWSHSYKVINLSFGKDSCPNILRSFGFKAFLILSTSLRLQCSWSLTLQPFFWQGTSYSMLFVGSLPQKFSFLISLTTATQDVVVSTVLQIMCVICVRLSICGQNVWAASSRGRQCVLCYFMSKPCDLLQGFDMKVHACMMYSILSV